MSNIETVYLEKERGRLVGQAHKYFDKIWKLEYLTRKKSYEWLAGQLKVDEMFAHMNMMGAERCKKVVEGSILMLNGLRRLDMENDLEPKTPHYDLIKHYLPKK